jgi:hypothetical protein
MARLANAANLGYVPLNTAAAAAIPTYIGLPYHLSEAQRSRVRIFDPCVGEGAALDALASGLHIPKDQRYACELHEGRAEQARAIAGHVLCGDTLKSLVAAERAYLVCYANPPFDHDGQEEGGGRLEEKFFERVVRDGRYVQVGGLVIWVTPQDILARRTFCEALAASLDDITAYALPDDARHFREVVLFGVVRRRERRGEERAEAVLRLLSLFAGDLPTLAPQAQPRYVLPLPEDRKPVWKLAATGSGREALSDIAITGGAWASSAYRALTEAAAPVMRPVMPMKRAYVAFAISRGHIDGITIPIHGEPHLIKGGTMEQVLTQTEERRAEGALSTIERTIRQEVACITSVSLTSGAVRQFVGAEGLTALMADSEAAKAITDAAVAAMPPFYAFDMEPWLATYLASITPPAALPGYPRCIIPMQQQLIASGIRGLNAFDPAWRRVRASHVYSATMGTGKTGLMTLTADAQVQLLTGEYRRWEGAKHWGDGSLTHGGVRRAPTVIVSAPGHLVGTQAQVDAFLRDGKGALPQWYSEWQGLLGGRYRMQILETPADVGAFFRGALADPTTPRVGFIADTVTKLDSGYDLGAERLTASAFQQWRAARFSDDDELERKDYERLRKRRRQHAQAEAQASASANAAGDDADDSALVLDWSAAIAKAETPEEAARLKRLQRDHDHFGLGVAVWTPLTDICGTVHSRENDSPVLHMRRRGRRRFVRNGLCCSHCGRMARTAKGDPIAAHTLKQSGLARIACEWCGEKLGVRSREQDSVKGRERAVFGDPNWRTRTITYRKQNGMQVVVPDRATRVRPITRLADGTVLPRPRYPLPPGTTVEWIEEVPSDYTTDDPEIAERLRYTLPAECRVVVEEEIQTIPWGEIPRSNPRYALAKLIRRRWKGFVDVFVADEFHECAGRSTAIGAAFGALCAASRFRVAGSGTGMNGYASSLYYPLLRLGCVPVQDRYGWDDEQRFVEESGILMEVKHTSQRVNGSGHFSGEPKVEVSMRQMPGMTALLGELFCNMASIVDLPDMGFHLPDYSEDAVVLPMHPLVKQHYGALESGGREVIAWGGHDALSAYLQATLSYPYQPWTPKTIYSELKTSRGSNSFAGPVETTVLPRDLVLPHHEWLAEFAATEVLAGRRVLVGIEHTGVDDICADVAEKIARIANARFGVTLKVATLRSSVARGERGLWFKEREREGVNIVLCHPKLVKTGLNLIQWPSIVVLEPNYSLEVVAQFIRRSFRPTQTKGVKVRFVCYEGAMSERAIELVAQKMGTLAMLNGNEFMTGISSIGEGMSILQQLAQSVTTKQPSERVDLRSAFGASAQSYKDSMETGAAGFLGVDTSRVVRLTRKDVVVPETPLAPVIELPHEASAPLSRQSPRPHVPAFGQTLADAVRRRKAAKQQAIASEQVDMFAAFGAGQTPSPLAQGELPAASGTTHGKEGQQTALW